MLHRVMHQLRIGGQTQLLEDAQAIGADRAQDQHRALRELALDLAEQLQPAAARHREIQDRHVPVELARKLQGFVAVLRLAHHLHIGLAGQDLLQAVPHHRVIVRDQDFHSEPPYFGRSGSDTVTCVPLPRLPLISSLPEKSSTRSRIPRSPSDLEPCISAAVMPLPLSWTSSVSVSASCRMPTSTLVAFAWRATFVSTS